MSAEDAEAVIIKRMRANTPFPPPRHLRADEDALEGTLAGYRKALSRFDAETLERAWELAVERNAVWCWPRLADLVQAAEQARRELDPGGKKAEAWVTEASLLSDAYVKRFMQSSQYATKAKAGGYADELREFVRASAWVQAQAIGGRTSFAYDASALFQLGESEEERDAWFLRQREQAQSGHIKVSIPRSLVKQWEAQAQGEGRGR